MSASRTTPSEKSERTRLINRARRLFENELRDQLLKDHYGSAVLIDGRSGDYEVQTRYEPRHLTRQRLLQRRPDAVVHIEHIVPEDYVYYIPASVLRDEGTPPESLSGDSR